MKQIDLTIKALSPLAIGKQKPGGSVSEALNYIPGTVIRGAIAAQILQQSERNGESFAENGGDFQALFLGEEPAIFQNGYPNVAKVGTGKNKIVTDEVRFLPTTAVSSKTKPGFKVSGNGVFDTLIDKFCAQALNHLYDPNDPKSLEDETDPRVEPYSGFYSKNNTGEYYSHSVSTRFLTRVGINRRRATSEDDILYSIEVLNEYALTNPLADEEPKKWENVVYQSAILIADEDLAENLKNFINININTHSFRLGGSGSRGLGKVEIIAKIVKSNKIENSKSEVKVRLEKFNTKLQQRWKLWSSIFNPSKHKQLENKVFFTLNLQSDAILTENWRSTTVISEAMLKEFTGVEDSSLKLEAADSSYDYRSGWNSAWGLMKDIELVTNKGGVYLFSVNKDRENDWIQALQELEINGVGEKTCEGFGQVRVCHDFHLIFRENAV